MSRFKGTTPTSDEILAEMSELAAEYRRRFEEKSARVAELEAEVREVRRCWDEERRQREALERAMPR